MGNTCRRDHEFSLAGTLLLISNCEPPIALQDKIEFVGVLVCVDALRLLRLETVQTHHNVLALPQVGFKKFLRLRSGVFAPV